MEVVAQLQMKVALCSSQIVTTNKPTNNFLQAGCPSCRPTNSVTALKESHPITSTTVGNYLSLEFMHISPSTTDSN